MIFMTTPRNQESSFKRGLILFPLNARKRFTKERTHCDLCEAENEDINHFLPECPTLNEVRVKRHELQKPYMEDASGI